MNNQADAAAQQPPTDRILRETRIVAAVVIPFLLLAFLILYLFPQTSAERFAWEINPWLLAMYIGAGYVGGAYFFAHVVFGREWHRVGTGFWSVTTFATSMLIATIFHWERFDLTHFPFQLWLILYAVTPFLIPYLWWRNRPQDPHILEAGDKEIPKWSRQIMLAIGVGLAIFALVGFFVPSWLVSFWPWPLTLLTARLLSGWHALLAVGGLAIGREARWSAWKVPLESIALWHVLVLLAIFIRAEDFNSGSAVNWYTAAVLTIILGIGGLYGYMLRQPAVS